MVKLVNATSDQTSADPHELLVDPIWYVERCKSIFEEHLTKGALPNCNAIPDQVSTGITIKKLVSKPGQKSKKRLVASIAARTTPNRAARLEGFGRIETARGNSHSSPAPALRYVGCVRGSSERRPKAQIKPGHALSAPLWHARQQQPTVTPHAREALAAGGEMTDDR